jgi:hypothetical protein
MLGNAIAAVSAVALLSVAFVWIKPKAKPPAAAPIEQATPANRVAERFVEFKPTVNVVRTVPIVRPPPALAPAPEPEPVVLRDPPPERIVRRARQRVARIAARRPADVCQRHGMRKVMVGRYKWRCRR